MEICCYNHAFKDQVIDLIVNIQCNEFGINISTEEQPDLSNIESFYQQGDGNFWVALINDRVVGTISLLDISNKQAALRKMFVHQQHRGPTAGVAQRLLNEAISWSKHKQLSEIFLGTTSQFLAAHRFYEKNNFNEIAKSQLPEKFPVMHVDTKFYQYAL